MGTEETRRIKQNWMKMMFKKAKADKKTLNRKKFIALFCLCQFSTKPTAYDLLKFFEDTDKIKIERGEIIPS